MLRKLVEIFDQLPIMTIAGKDYKPMFRFGTKERLVADLSLRRKKGRVTYPLVYLETPFEQNEEVKLKFVIATMNKRTDMLNEERLQWTYDEILSPLRAQVYKALLRSGVFKRTEKTPYKNYKGEIHFNYNITPDIWDALSYEIDLRFSDDCKVKKIYF